MNLDNKVAIVTGAASGFGAEIARQYVRRGARVVLADINQEGAQALASELGENALAIRTDVTRAADIDALVAATVTHFGTVDIVVNNAGWTHVNQPMMNIDEATFDRMFDINVKSIFFMNRAVLPILRAKRSGVILNIGSSAGIRPRPGLTYYNSTKGAVNILSKSMAVELGPDNIRVNAICPVMGETGMLEAFMGMPDTPENRKKFIASIPLGRLSTPRDIANAAVYLASDEAEFISGVEFPVDGGRCV
jgi:3-oxoacyl-[acyl-carrier protein] reductase